MTGSSPMEDSMINIETAYGNYCITLGKTSRLLGKGQVRPMVVAELWRNGQLVSAGMALCHPTDAFDPRKGAHIAVNKMGTDLFDKQDMSKIHKKVDSWFR